MNLPPSAVLGMESATHAAKGQDHSRPRWGGSSDYDAVTAFERDRLADNLPASEWK